MVTMQSNVRPTISSDDAGQIVREYYGLQAAVIKELTAELDRNFYVRAADGSAYILKIAHQDWEDAVLNLQNAALTYLDSRVDFCPTLVRTLQQDNIALVVDAAQRRNRVRLLTYLDGQPLVDFRPHSADLLRQIGSRLGQLSSALQDFFHPAKRQDYRWNITNVPQVARYADDMPAEKRELVEHFAGLYRETVMPQLSGLRHSFIYNDANDHNILVKPLSPEHIAVTGMIDFGDMTYAPTVAELAVALAYVMMGKDNPLDAAAAVIQGYHEQFALTEQEVSLLYVLVAARLCLSVCISWYQQRQEPDNQHLSISEVAAWDLLKRWRDIHPNFAHSVFRNACGWSPHPNAQAVTEWLRRATAQPILGYPLTAANTVLFDLSVGSSELGTMDEFTNTALMTRRLFERLEGGKVGVGRYDEARPIYTTDKYAVTHLERRTVHIGADLFAPPGTPIYAPLAGEVFSVRDNGSEQDYGPTLILKHEPEAGVRFYTLYGHLSETVLDQWRSGDTVTAGQALAAIGDYPRNGDWPPHLHFQIITDMLDYQGDFPGVVSPCHREVWLSLAPNPDLILRLPCELRAQRSVDAAALISARRERLNPSMSVSYKRPLQIMRGYLHHLYDENGQTYLDCVNNVPHVGHSHPRVVRAAQRQMALLNTNTRYLHPLIIEYAERLRATLPEALSVCFFVNSGSEANELAIRLAQTTTGGMDFIVIDHAYHGHTTSLIDLSPYKFNGRGGRGKPDHVEIAALPDGYRGAVRGFDAETGRKYAESVRQAAERIQQRGHKLAGFFSEGVLSCGGQLTLPDGYLRAAFEHIRAAGGVCIADEVQIGFGRVGTHMWAFETQGVVPDIVTMGKPIGNGHPLAAVVTTRAIADAFNNGMEYFNTFGGNPVSCAVGLEVLKVLQEEGLQENARVVGDYFQERLRALQSQHPIIGHVRGSGLFLGVEFIRDQDTLEPADHETAYIAEQMRERGFLVSTEGPHHNVIKIKPPLIFQKQHVDLFTAALDDVLSHTVLKQIGAVRL
ncbi:MAG: aminotransferase class III-fold pyridoxal phosphate-dependent enzyme [Anaerolineae bacterium]|nr:aminotransferase class III-fold pyridoxal phosphate-dependent enzyme [Anaerolineae bacterium]